MPAIARIQVEVQHLVIFVFTESRVVFLWVYIWSCVVRLGGFGSRRVWMRGGLFGRSLWCWADLHPRCHGRHVWNKWVRLNENELYHPSRDVRVHIWSGDHNAIPGRTNSTGQSASAGNEYPTPTGHQCLCRIG